MCRICNPEIIGSIPIAGFMAVLTTDEKINAWRVEVFERLGFGREDAELLAMTKQDNGFFIDSEIVRNLARSGCPLELIKRIVL